MFSGKYVDQVTITNGTIIARFQADDPFQANGNTATKILWLCSLT